MRNNDETKILLFKPYCTRWMPDLAGAGALEVLDPYVAKYGYADELQKIAATYRENQMMVDGKIYGFPDDGDVFVMYYRKDIFADPKV